MGRHETPVQNEVLRRLATRAGLRLWRANVGVGRALSDPDRVMKFGVNGQADLTGVLRLCPSCPSCGAPGRPVGLRIEFECKRPDGGTQSEDQRNYQAMIERHGGLYLLVSDPAAAVAAVEKLLGANT